MLPLLHLKTLLQRPGAAAHRAPLLLGIGLGLWLLRGVRGSARHPDSTQHWRSLWLLSTPVDRRWRSRG
jgi:hypothetical protein